MINCTFDMKHYSQIIESFIANEYKFIFYYEEIINYKKQVIVRHDIDQSIEYAYQMALIESELGAKSTYFVWLTSPFYNVFEPKNKQYLEQIVSLGHDIGLHFDPTAYSDEVNAADKIRYESDVLSSLINHQVNSFSFHRPNPLWINEKKEVDGLINAYDSIFFNEFKYLSDSNHNWREGCVCNKINDYTKIHLLTHSIWWSFEKNMSQIDKINAFATQKYEQLKVELSRNIKNYKL